MKILHSSDLHGSYKELLMALEGDFDVWVDTGDFFPNKTRGDRNIETSFQNKWFSWNKWCRNDAFLPPTPPNAMEAPPSLARGSPQPGLDFRGRGVVIR